MNKIDLRDEGEVAILTLSDPDRRNAIDLEMTGEIVAAIRQCEERPEIGAVVVTGEGKGFCAGASLGAIEAADQDAFRQIYGAFMSVARCQLPTVAAVNGAAVGAGMNLALACDLRIASDRARFISRFLELGLHPGGGHTWMLTKAVGPQVAAAMVLFGEELRGQEAVDRGLAYSCVEGSVLLETAVEIAARSAAVPRELSVRGKQTLSKMGQIQDHDAALELELEAQLWSSNQDFYGDRMEAMQRRISGSDR